MGLEAVSFINDLVVANPVGAVDQKAQGDDHLRLIKTVLKATFPLAVGARKFRDDTLSAADTLSWTLYRNRTGVANDLLGSYVISGNDSAAAETVALRLQARWDDPTNGSEDTAALLKVMIAGVETTVMTINAAGALFSVPLIGTGRPPTGQLFIPGGAASPWARPTGCRFVMVEGVGGGGGSGGISPAAAGEAGSTGGGGSGMWGWSELIDVSAIATAAFTLGTGGVAGNNTGTAGGNGVATVITFGATVLTFNPGFGSNGYNPSTSINARGDGGAAASLTSVNITRRGSSTGANGNSNGGNNADGGNGGQTPFGRPGDGGHRATPSGSVAGGAITGFGVGAGGAAVVGTDVSGEVGAVGAPGFIRVTEYY